MNVRSIIGKIGEDHAILFLEENGYKILHRNWRSKHLEIDIIAYQDDMLIIVEVKTRKSVQYGLPFESIDYKKQQNLGRAANAFMVEARYYGDVRFDIVSIVLNTLLRPSKVELVQDAFWFR